MGKFLGYRKAKPGETFFGGRGVIIPRPFAPTPPEPLHKPSTKEVPPKQPEPPKSGGTD
jgi:hypothetical protein